MTYVGWPLRESNLDWTWPNGKAAFDRYFHAAIIQEFIFNKIADYLITKSFKNNIKSQENVVEGQKHPLLKYKRGSIDNAAFDRPFSTENPQVNN